MEPAEYRKKFLEAAERQGWRDAEGIVCALSGGGDSVAMMWLMRKFFKGRIVAAHLDHCTREGASHDDAAFAASLCAELGVECALKAVDVRAARTRGESFEMAGRRARYEHFSAVAERYGIKFIAVAHNANDVVETQLLNLARGSGIAGLRGIPERRGNIVRPVISFTREELRAILKDNGVTWREDYTNDETDYTRNKIRNTLIPWIKENLNEGFERVMLGLAKQACEEAEERISAARVEIAKATFALPPALAAWRTEGLAALPKLTLAEMLRTQGAALSLPALPRARTEELVSLIRRGGAWRFQWARDIEVCYSSRGVGWLHRADIRSGKNSCEKKIPWWARAREI